MQTTAALLALVLMAAAIQELQLRRLPPSNGSVSDEFGRVQSVRELGDGRVIIADEVDQRLVVADLRAGTVHALSRRGSGPGEYERLPTLVPGLGDTTILMDAPRGKLLVLDGARIVDAQTGVKALPSLRQALPPVPLGSDGKTLLAKGAPPSQPVATRVTGAGDSVPLMTIAIPTGRLQTIGKLRRQPSRLIVTRSPSLSYYSVYTAWTLGEAAVMCDDGWIAVLRMEPYRVDWRAPDGRWINGRPIPYAPVPVTEREKSVFSARDNIAIPGVGPPHAPPDWPSHIPPQGTIYPSCAPDARVFILRTFTADRQYPMYDIVDRNGVLVEQLALDSNQKLIGFGPRSIYVVRRDSVDLERLFRYPYPWR